MITPEECVAIGGHCWVQSPVVMTQAVIGGVSNYERRCKHCGTRQVGRSQEPIVWTQA